MTSTVPAFNIIAPLTHIQHRTFIVLVKCCKHSQLFLCKCGEYLNISINNTYDMTHKTCARLAFAFCKYIFLFGFVSLVLYIDLVKVSDSSMICSILSEKKIGRVVHACCIISESGLEHSFLTP